MSLRDGLAYIQAQHDYCGAEARSGVAVQTCACGWEGDSHDLHVADLQVAYLRDNLGQHPELFADLTIHQRRLITRIASGWGLSYDYRRFDDIPVDTLFADKYGRVHTKTSAGSARSMAVAQHAGTDSSDWPVPKIDTSREYFDLDEDEDEDPCVFDSWPYYRLP